MRRHLFAFFAVWSLGACLTMLLAMTACYGNVASDSPGDPALDAGSYDGPRTLGGGLRLSEVIPPTMNDGGPNPLHPAQDASVYITGTSIVVIDSFDETQNGKGIGAVYVQDVAPPAPAGATCGACVPPNSGVQLYKPNYSPPNLIVAPGDVVDLDGLYQDYAYATFPAGFTFPEIYEPVVTFRFEFTPPQPTILTEVVKGGVPIGQLPDPINLGLFNVGHQWLGMLVEIDNVDITSSQPDGAGRQALFFTSDTTRNAPNISNELFDLDPADYGCPTTALGPTPTPIGGACSGPKSHLSKLIGVVTYFFNFHIAPRSAADLVR